MREGACLAGWREPYQAPGDWLAVCPDLDECAFPGVCPSGVCTNSEGSFSCRDCGEGYRPSPLGHTCKGESCPPTPCARTNPSP